eukprot:6186559-Pleurochrysis_carterae.AAC.8
MPDFEALVVLVVGEAAATILVVIEHIDEGNQIAAHAAFFASVHCKGARVNSIKRPSKLF